MNKAYQIACAIKDAISGVVEAAIGPAELRTLPMAFILLASIRSSRKTLASTMWRYRFHIRVQVEATDYESSLQQLSSLLDQIRSALEADRTLGGVATTLEVESAALTEGLRGAADIEVEVVA